MASIGSLAVNVIAKTDPFARGMRGARKELGLLGSAVGAANRIMLGFGATMAAGISIRSLQIVAREMDEVAKMSDRLGMTTEALTGLGRAADLAGVSSKQMGTALSFMERNVDAAHEAFKRMQLDVQMLQRLKPETQFLKIADAIAKIPSPGGRLQAARDVFGKQGEELMPLMLGGSEKIRREMAMHPGFSRSGAGGVEDMQDSWTRVKHSLSQTAQTLITKFGPAIEGAASALNSLAGGADFDQVTKWTKELNKLTDPQFAAFRTQWNKASSTAESDAARKFFGKETGMRMYMNQNSVNAAIREREMVMAERHQETVARASPFAGPGMFDDFAREDSVLKGFQALEREIPKLVDGFKKLGVSLNPFKTPSNPNMGGLPFGLGIGGLPMMMGMDAMMGASIDSAMNPGVRGDGRNPYGFQALEAGTAEAFAQERRSANQGRGGGENEKMQLKTQEQMLAELKKLNANQKPQAEVMSLT